MVQHQQVQYRRTQSAGHVKDQKSFGTPVVLEYASEHPQGEHIEKNMFKSAMEEHIRDQLMRAEKDRTDFMQREEVLDAEIRIVRKYVLSDKNEYVYYDQVFNDGGNNLKAPRSEFSHNFVFSYGCKLVL
jgi:hypothetical protein